MKLGSLLTALSLGLSLPFPVLAQSPGAIDQGEALRRQRDAEQLLKDLRQEKLEEAPTISPDEAVDVGPQSILKTRERHRWFEMNLDSQFYWTDNMFFNESGAVPTVNSTVLASSAQFNLTPPRWSIFDKDFRPRVGYQHIWMNYALVGASRDPNTGFLKNDNDFDAQTVFADLTHSWGNWQAQVGFDWQRLLGHQPTYAAYTEFYRDYSPRWSLSRVYALGEKQSLIAAYLGAHHFSHVDPTPGLSDGNRNDRTDHNLLLTYNYQLAPRVYLQPGYRFQFAHYSHGHRLDQIHAFTGSVTVLLTDWLFARFYAGYELRESDAPLIPDYRKLDSGIALGASFRF